MLQGSEDQPMTMLLVTLKADAANRAAVEEAVRDFGIDAGDEACQVVFLSDLGADERAGALRQATVIFSHNTAKELEPDEMALIEGVRLLQFISAGVDFIPLEGLPADLPIACNGGAYAEPMAEHGMAMTLSAMKRLFIEQAKLADGTFDQFRRNRMLAGSTCGILGFGGIGIATARLMKALGANVHAINRRGASDEPVDWIGTDAQLDQMLAACDVVVLSLPLTPETAGVIGARELSLMKADAVLVNLARGEIIDEEALYAHLKANSEFTACIDAWWTEPVRHGHFSMRFDFLSLPNVIASPHNSASVFGWRKVAVRRAIENIARVLAGEEPRHLVPSRDRMM